MFILCMGPRAEFYSNFHLDLAIWIFYSLKKSKPGISDINRVFFMILIIFVNSIRVELLMPNCCVGEKFMI